MKTIGSFLQSIFNPWLTAICTAAAAALVGYWQGSPPLMHNLLWTGLGLLLINTILGSIAARREAKYDGGKELRFIPKLIVYVLAVLFGACLNGIGAGYAGEMAALGFIVWREGTGCLDKFKALGIDLSELGKYLKLKKD